ncbi:alpha/beta fold hydrolase [Nocardia asteroides]|uniref:alpha/beta fold hydrolase n=1 Tax=Nocardia asteroides TaxID=1824 RepID=UPI001E5ADEC2|nr:alpha/beta hydrolase [Nocardia asteroides]UGT61986.1 alpha/beta hydrolase [Nocardia asteroides]
MTTIETATLAVPGARLHYEVRGRGPVLLISQSGEGDANRTGDLVGLLAEEFTVVTYDRRGLSRSTIDDPSRPITMATHAADVHHLLTAVTSEPAYMLGCSIGAVIGLRLALEHPGQLHTLIAHEPVAPSLLAAPDRAAHLRELEYCQQVFHAEGWRAALAPVARTLGIDPACQEVEPGIRLPAITAERAAGFGHFLGHDLTAVRADRLDVAALRHSSVRIIPAVGSTTPAHVFDRKCAVALAALLGTGIAIFAGGHNGSMTHPRGYALRLSALLG